MDAAAIQVVLLDGDPTGIIYAEMHDWAGQIAIFPRNRVEQLINDPAFSCPALYLLLGEDQSDFSRESIYVGETESASTRIKQHMSAKDKTFWQRVIVLTSSSGSLNKAHIKSLESMILKDLEKANSAKIKNQNKSLSLPHLARHDQISVQRYFNNFKLILRSLGYKFFDAKAALGFENDSSKNPTILNYSNPIFELKSVGIHAFGRMLGDSFVVSKGSTLRHLPDGTHSFFVDQLVSANLLEPTEGMIHLFLRDVSFTSPSIAASVITGTTRSGWSNWKVISTGITMRAWKDEMDQIFGFEVKYPEVDYS